MSQSELRQVLERVLSGQVRTLLRSHGFTKSRRTFSRHRDPLYDTVNFQGNKWNGLESWHGFFVNVEVASTEIDALSGEKTPVLHRRWKRVVPELPSEVRFDMSTDADRLAEQLCDGLSKVLRQLDAFDSTYSLAHWAVAHNKLWSMEATCAYLASVDDVETLVGYIESLTAEFGHETRWPFFNDQLIDATGRWAPELTRRGLLTPPSTG